VKITIKNIFHFIEGNTKMLGDKIHLLSQHEKEQVVYRSQICKQDCVQFGYCIQCGCNLPGKFYVTESCNPDRFPNIMSKLDWEKFKIENQIILE
jgi:hypothetical protein